MVNIVQENWSDSRQQLITSGPLIKATFSLAIPVVLGMFMEVALSVTDFFWVGKLGAAAQDSITTSMVVIWTLFSAISIITIGVTALVSRHIGAGNVDRAAHYIRQGVMLSGLVGGVVTVCGIVFSADFIRFMGAGPNTAAMALPYLQVFFLACPLLFFAETLYAVFRASGDTRTPTIVGIAAVVLNMLLDPLLIFGYGPVPAMGVTGASIASGIAFLFGAVAISVFLRKGKLGYRVHRLFAEKPKLKSLSKISRIGLPIATQQLAFVVVYWFLIGYVHRFGESAGAAMGIGNRMESCSYLTCYGFSLAASTLVGQNLGAGKPERAARAAWGATGLGVGLTLIFSTFLLTIPETIASIFTSDPATIAIAADYLIILGLSQFTMAIEIILEGAFSGAGDTLPPMIVMIPGAILRIPLAYWLAFELNWGINGIWWTLTLTTTVKALALAYWFKLGHWKSKQV